MIRPLTLGATALCLSLGLLAYTRISALATDPPASPLHPQAAIQEPPPLNDLLARVEASRWAYDLRGWDKAKTILADAKASPQAKSWAAVEEQVFQHLYGVDMADFNTLPLPVRAHAPRPPAPSHITPYPGRAEPAR